MYKKDHKHVVLGSHAAYQFLYYGLFTRAFQLYNVHQLSAMIFLFNLEAVDLSASCIL